jgi:hypothetical protein
MGPRCGRGPILVRTTAIAAAIPVVLAAALGSPVSSATASSCGDAVLQDWFDNGRVDRLYPLPCYEEARASLPHDIRDYSDADDVIERALSAAARGTLARGGLDPSPAGASDSIVSGAAAALGAPGSVTAAPALGTAVQGAKESPYRPRIALAILLAFALILIAAGSYEHLSRSRDGRTRHDDRDQS